jgi:hypothetical protein
MDAFEQFAAARLALSVHLQAVFNDAKVLDARDWRIFAGIARYFREPQVPYGVTDTERATRLGIKARYGVVLQPRPAAVGDDRGEVSGFNFPRTLDEANRGKVRVVPSFFVKRRADLVWDDADELAACEFPYPEVTTRLTLATRAKVYGGSLAHIKPPADGGTSGFFDTGARFYSTAATQATYDTAADGQPYYAKWIAPKPVLPKDRVFNFDRLSDAYLQLNYRAYDLEKGAVHLFLAIGQISIVAKLYFDARGQLAYDAILGERLPLYGNYFEIIAYYVKTLKAKNQKVQGEAWFVHTLEGTNHPPPFSQQDAPVSANLSLNVMEQVVDPQSVVQAAAGLALEQLDPLQKKLTSRDWLKEMVRLRFSEPWVWFWKNADIQMFYTIDREELFLKNLRDAERTAVGPLKQTLRDFIKKADADPNLYMVRRGSNYGSDKRVIGSDESYVYFYNNKQRLVTRLPMFVFWRDTNMSQISEVIYENTRGMIPIGKVIVWGGLVVVGWAVIGTDILIEGFRQYIKEKLRGVVVDKLLKAAFEKAKYRLLVLLIFPVLELFRLVPSGGATSGRKIYAFIKGFAEGFTEHAFNAMMDRWISFFNLEPASVHAIKLIMKLEAILRWVDEKMSALKGYVDDQVAELLMNRFVSVAVDAGTGLISLIDNLYFLDYEQAKEFLAVYAELAGEPVPSQADWDRLRHRHLLETFRHWEQAVKDEAKDVADIYDDVQEAVRVARLVVKGVELAALANVLTAGGLAPLMVLALRGTAKGVVSVARSKSGKVAAAGFITVAILDDDFRKEVLEFLGDFANASEVLTRPAGFAWGTAERMQRFGQLLGIIIASIAISKGVIKEGKWKDRWTSRKSYPRFVSKHLLVSQFKVSPVLPAIKLALFHYVQLIEKVITESKKSFVDLEARIEDILLGDPRYRDIIEVDEGLTLAKLLEILKAVDQLLTEWLTRLAKIPGLTGRISEMAAKLKDVAPNKLPTLDQLRDGTYSEAGWVGEAFMFVVLSHLQGGLSWLAQALESMLRPVNPDDPSPVSVAFLLQTLGFNLNEADALEVLDRNFDQVFQEDGG